MAELENEIKKEKKKEMEKNKQKNKQNQNPMNPNQNIIQENKQPQIQNPQFNLPNIGNNNFNNFNNFNNINNNKNDNVYTSNKNDEDALLDFMNDNKPVNQPVNNTNNINNNNNNYNRFQPQNNQYQNFNGNNNQMNQNIMQPNNNYMNGDRQINNNFNNNNLNNDKDIFNFLNNNMNDLKINEQPQNNNLMNQNNNNQMNQNLEKKEVNNQNVEKEIIKEKVIDENKLTSDNVIELCPEAVENKYHNIKFMESVSLLTEEIKMMDIISNLYKKSKDKDDTYEVFDMKKKQCENKCKLLTQQIENGIIDIKQYYQKVIKCIGFQKRFIENIDKDPKLKYKIYTRNRINERIKILNKEADELLESIKQAEEEEKKNIIEERLEDYKKAQKYFEENNMSEKQISDTKKIIKIFELSLNKIEEGKGKEIKLEKLPKEIDYEFIYGMSTQERNEKFNQVLSFKKIKTR